MEPIRVIVNGIEKLATGLTKETTVEEILFAMLYSSIPKFKKEMLNDYGLYEQWQSNERILDLDLKMYKIIKIWKKLPGDQLSQVKFVIKSKKVERTPKKFKFCSLSPNVQKTWNENLIGKNRNLSSYIRKELEVLNGEHMDKYESNEYRNRYASIKRNNKSRSSSVKRVNEKKLEEIGLLRNEIKNLQTDLLKVKTNNLVINGKLIESLENELKKLNRIQINTKAQSQLASSGSTSSIGSTDTGFSSTHSENEDDRFPSQRFETLV
ncbi:unnamed protein product [Brachionus calyciflorus]|uniref:Ras-associating domain-containing protein n=1 Tax=Brachionus calyciflorus TaxID=104777 RepID=A0A814A4Y0_9BILA|nr:unnamed protein product [Brachionus calyciflorus]